MNNAFWLWFWFGWFPFLWFWPNTTPIRTHARVSSASGAVDIFVWFLFILLLFGVFGGGYLYWGLFYMFIIILFLIWCFGLWQVWYFDDDYKANKKDSTSMKEMKVKTKGELKSLNMQL
tara:strand:+ start:4983 stop:5339 length:357 start_codon:yes stop_codon:yes gene_type:complete